MIKTCGSRPPHVSITHLLRNNRALGFVHTTYTSEDIEMVIDTIGSDTDDAGIKSQEQEEEDQGRQGPEDCNQVGTVAAKRHFDNRNSGLARVSQSGVASRFKLASTAACGVILWIW